LEKKRKSDSTHFGRLRKIPGMPQAFLRVFEYSEWYHAEHNRESGIEEKTREIATKGVRKIAELWELSEAAEELLLKKWVERKPRKMKSLKPKIGEAWMESKPKKPMVTDTTKSPRKSPMELFSPVERIDKSNELGVNIVIGEERKLKELQKVCNRLKEINVNILSSKGIRRNHVYLDVTEIDYKTFTKAYKTIMLCREKLGVNNKRDLGRGAPESIDGTKAIVHAIGEERGVSRKKLAEIKGFKIYREDNPSGSYPLVHKYLKIGRETNIKLDILEKYMQSVTGLILKEN